jgi:hypothetical protein
VAAVRNDGGAKTNTGEVSLSGANSFIVGQAIGIVGRLNSECSQQNSANKNKRDAHSQYIQSQGTVHGRASLADVRKS